MAEKRPYTLHSDEEPARLDRQAKLIGIEQFLPNIPSAPNGRILDAGCGAGSMTRLLARTRRDDHISGVDIRPAYLDFARRMSIEEGLGNIEFTEGSLLSLPFPDNHFDVVWISLVLHWLSPEDLPRALQELTRVVRSGGYIVCAEPDGVGSNHFPIAADLAKQWKKVTTAMFDPDMGRRLYPLFHDAGLVSLNVEIKPYFFHAFGKIDPDVMEIITDALRPALPKIAEILGGRSEAERMLERIVDQHESSSTIFFPLWFIVSGRKPA